MKWRYYKAIHTLKITLSNLSMFIITFVFGIIILKNDKKELPVIKDDQNNINSNKNEIEAENKENEKLEDSEIIQENEDFSVFLYNCCICCVDHNFQFNSGCR